MSHNRKPGRAFTYIIYPKITVLPKSLLHVCYTRCKPTTAELPCLEQDSSRKVGSAWGHKTVGMSDFMTPPKIMGKEGIQKCSRCYRNVTKLLETCVPEPLVSGSDIICVISSSSPASLLDNLGSISSGRNLIHENEQSKQLRFGEKKHEAPHNTGLVCLQSPIAPWMGAGRPSTELSLWAPHWVPPNKNITLLPKRNRNRHCRKFVSLAPFWLQGYLFQRAGWRWELSGEVKLWQAVLAQFDLCHPSETHLPRGHWPLQRRRSLLTCMLQPYPESAYQAAPTAQLL